MENTQEPDRPNLSEEGLGLLTCPFAKDLSSMHEVRGRYEHEYPKGAVIHYTASDRDPMDLLKYGAKQGYAYWLIDTLGVVYQTHPLNMWGYHAGKSSYKGLEGTVSQHLLGIELVNAGLLQEVDASRYLSWYGKLFRKTEVRTIKKKRGNMMPGSYHKVTQDQENALIALLCWLRRNNPAVFKFKYVVGHDEVSPGRKVDPGGCIPWTMPELRQFLTLEE